MASVDLARRRSSMGRDFGSSEFSSSQRSSVQDLDPMSGIANVVDAMLVFACGLLIALMITTGMNPSALTTQYTPTGEMQDIEDPDQVTESADEGGKGYEEAGTAYYDPATGKYFIEVQE